jgi:hypothetical protein
MTVTRVHNGFNTPITVEAPLQASATDKKIQKALNSNQIWLNIATVVDRIATAVQCIGFSVAAIGLFSASFCPVIGLAMAISGLAALLLASLVRFFSENGLYALRKEGKALRGAFQSEILFNRPLPSAPFEVRGEGRLVLFNATDENMLKALVKLEDPSVVTFKSTDNANDPGNP